MNKAFSFAILIAGIVLLLFGLNAGDSVASEAKEVITGTPTDKSMILVITGVIGIVVGGFSALSGRRN
jgi:hypothetical protein